MSADIVFHAQTLIFEQTGQFHAQTLIFEQTGQKAEIEVPAAHRLVVLTSTEATTAVPPLPPGTYEISADALAGCAPFPIAVAVVPVIHFAAWMELTQAQVGRMLARCSREAAAIRSTGARLQ